MKKNAMLKIAAILLVAVLLTTCAISTTFAKYTESAQAEAVTARVAAWGIDVNTDFATTADNTLFKTSYGTDGTAIVSADTTNVVAPGASNVLCITNVANGTAEVKGQISISTDVEFTGDWMVDGSIYMPLKFRVGKGSAPATDDAWIEIGELTTLDAFEALIESACGTVVEGEGEEEDTLEAYVATTFAANEELENKATNLYIEWMWDFDVSAAYDAKDTALAEKTTNVPSISFQFTITVEQTA